MLVLWIAVRLVAVSPLQIFRDIYQGSLSSPEKLSLTFARATPLLLTGLAVHIALRAGLFNIGADGQFIVGALICVEIALHLNGF